jgi:hypothetical protein
MDSHCRIQPKGQLDDLFGIERSDLKYAPGPAGLSYIGTERESQLPAKLERVSAAEPGVKVGHGAVAFYRDANGTPAVIVKNHGKGRTIYLNALITDYHRWRLQPPEGESLRQFVATWLRNAGVGRQYEIAQSNGRPALGIEIHPWRAGDLRMLGIHRNYGLNVSDLGPPEYQKQDALEGPLELKVDFGKTVALYDARRGEFLGNRKDYTFQVHKIQPTILTVLPQPVNGLTITAPQQAKAGELVGVQLKLPGAKSGNTHTFRVMVLDPDGRELRMLTRNLAAPNGEAIWDMPLAVNSARGQYILQVRDVPTGTRAERRLVVQ